MKSLKSQLLVIGCILVSLCSHAWADTNFPFGATLQGAISSAAQTNTYTFDASAGDVVLLTMGTSGGAPEITLLNPDGSQNSTAAPGGCDFNGVTTVEMSGGMNGVKLTETGTYTVVVGACNSEDTFSYAVYLQRTNNPGGAIGLQWGQTLGGTITSVAQSSTYTFSANASDVVKFTMATNGFAPKITLFNPDGSQNGIAYPGGCDFNGVTAVEMNPKLTVTGTYTVLVGACNDDDTNNYSFYIQRTNDPGDAVPIVWGQTEGGKIVSAAQSDTYTFSGSPDDVVEFIMATNDFAPKITLFNPDGSQNNIAYPSGCDFNGVTTVEMNRPKLTVSGTYTVLVGACNDEDQGTYDLSSQCFVGACLLPTPVVTSISPTSALAGSGPLTLTVNGAGFANVESSSVVQWNDIELTTDFVSTTQLTAAVPGTDTNVGGVFPVTVFTPGVGTSPPVNFTVYPTITGVSPNCGAPAALIEISGMGFGATPGSVTVGGAPSYIVLWSNTLIAVQVPSRATTGNIVVTAGGVSSEGPAAPFTVYPYPVITDVSPGSGPVGNLVIITGTGLTDGCGNVMVTFNGTPAAILSQTSTSIQVDVPAGATTGPITVGANGVTVKSSSFTVIAPQIESISPNYGAPGALITINGTDLGATQGNGYVTVGGALSRPVSWSDTLISITVPSNATTGCIKVTLDGESSNCVPFTFYPYPAISGLSLTSGAVGTPVTITGTGLMDGGGNGKVTFNGTSAPILSTPPPTSTRIQVDVPAGAASGPISVYANGDTVKSSTNFTVIPQQIESISPNYGAPAALIGITGTNFGATQGNGYVSIDGAICGVNAWSDTSITIRVPSNAKTGNLVVIAGGEVSNGVPFTFYSYPSITSVSPDSGAVGTPVTITGTGLMDGGGNGKVTFNGIPAPILSTSTSTSIRVDVPAGASSGPITVNVNGDTVKSSSDFTVIAPQISGISHNYGAPAALIGITGTDFGATQGNGYVSIDGAICGVNAWSDTSITIRVPSNAKTGNLVVIAGGEVSNGVPFTFYSYPSITSVSPDSGAVGTTVTFTGSNLLDGADNATVTFNGTRATIASDTSGSIQVSVPTGATSGRLLVRINGVTVIASSSFTITSPPQ